MASETATLMRVRADREAMRARVLAESSLAGERVVAIVRVALMVLLGLATVLVPKLTGTPIERVPLRFYGALGYLFFGVVTLVALYRAKPDPRRAFTLPFFFMAGDFGYLVAQAWIGVRTNAQVRPESTAALLALFICFSVTRFSKAHVAASVGLATLVLAISAQLNGWFHPVWFAFVTGCFVALGGLLYWLNGQLKRMFADLRLHEKLSDLLPRQVVERVLAAGGAPLEPVMREVTVLFSDIRDFTSLSEKLPPREVLDLLDGYFAEMSQIVKGREGMVNKFIGDGMLAVWGVPDLREDHAELALKAALDMRKKLAELNQQYEREGRAPLRIGIGIHTGLVAAGMLGGQEQHEYTVIGDAVNLASRIEGLTKNLGADILVSERAWQLGGKRLEAVRVGAEKVKGRSEAVVVYALSPEPPRQPQLPEAMTA